MQNEKPSYYYYYYITIIVTGQAHLLGAAFNIGLFPFRHTQGIWYLLRERERHVDVIRPYLFPLIPSLRTVARPSFTRDSAMLSPDVSAMGCQRRKLALKTPTNLNAKQ